MSKSAWTAWAVKNSVVMLCFAALAIHFNHWWIVLFAAFFMSSLERKSPASRVCDGCGKTIYSLDWDAIDVEDRAGGMDFAERMATTGKITARIVREATAMYKQRHPYIAQVLYILKNRATKYKGLLRGLLNKR